MRPEGYYVNEKSTDTRWDRTSDLNHCATAVPSVCQYPLNYRKEKERAGENASEGTRDSNFQNLPSKFQQAFL